MKHILKAQTALLVVVLMMPLCAYSASTMYFVHNDHLGTPQFVTNGNEQVVWEQSQTAFGEAVVDEDPDGDSTSFIYNQRFPGQYFDEESNLHYNYFRDYDPSTGRYIQSDPIGLAGGINIYLYVESNPINSFDFLGLASCKGAWIKVNQVDDPIGIGPIRGCTCNWICRPCEGPNLEPMQGDPYAITANRTRGTKYSDASGAGLEDGNACSCAKPSKEEECCDDS